MNFKIQKKGSAIMFLIQNGTLVLNLFRIGYDDVTRPDPEDDISVSNKFEGSWNLQVPFNLDTTQTKKITFNTESKEYGLEKIIVSPYQVVTDIAVPYTEREVTREDYEEKMADKIEGSDDPGISYEEYVEMVGKTYAESHTFIFNQDGEEIDARGGYENGKTVFAVKGKKITKLHVLVFDSLDSVFEVGNSGLTDELIEAAVNYEVVEIE